MGNDYQAIVIGAGPGGYPCGIRLAQLGVKTLVVEKEHWGGVCLNVGCIPSKALITAAKRYEEIRTSDFMGIEVTGDVRLDMGKLQTWKGGITGKLNSGVRTLLKGNGAETTFGTATITGPHEVEITSSEGARRVTADHIVIATGSRPIQIPGFSFADAPVLDSTKALALGEIPGHVVVIGGGYIGLELGGMLAKLGTKITVVEAMGSLLPGFDPDCVKVIARNLKKHGVETLLETKALGWEMAEQGIVVRVQAPDGERRIAADYVLVTVGRFPNTEGIGLEAVGVQLDGRFIRVDEQRRTSVPHIFAIGDVACQPMLAHKATYEGELVAEIIAGHKRKYDARTVPAVVFTDPEIAIAGLDEAQARARGPVKVGKVPYAAIGRALTTGETEGFYKVILDAETKVVLGVTICGSHASDLISEAALAIEMVAEGLDLGLTIHPHPTMGEGVMEAAKAALGEAIHVLNR
ncbi:MAG TPA: dihydrolipoyl dehydrogenase [Myxococcota bacterium]|nr:dihydrolipoyl dehydrogenase [Myxococcota bacterium]